MFGGTEISKDVLVSDAKQAAWIGRGCNWGGSLFVLAMAMLFGGVAWNWFDAQHTGGGAGLRALQLAAGAAAMGLLVSVPGSLFFGRNPIRWGMGMTILVYLAGVLVALVMGRSGVSGLIMGAPVLMGVSIATGVMGAFLVDGAFSREAVA